jgi:hypothetical protein
METNHVVSFEGKTPVQIFKEAKARLNGDQWLLFLEEMMVVALSTAWLDRENHTSFAFLAGFELLSMDPDSLAPLPD